MYGAKMAKDEMMQFIKGIGRCELFDEIEDAKRLAHDHTTRDGQSRYMKAVRVTLVTLGFDEDWVDTEFRDALESYYYDGQAAIDNAEKMKMFDEAGKLFASIVTGM